MQMLFLVESSKNIGILFYFAKTYIVLIPKALKTLNFHQNPRV